MELWGWLVGYVVLFAALHLLLYYFYVRRNGDDHASAPSFDGRRAGARYSSGTDVYAGSNEDSGPDSESRDRRNRDHDDREGQDDETIQCPYCGTTNVADQTFTYCWNCVSTLRQ